MPDPAANRKVARRVAGGIAGGLAVMGFGARLELIRRFGSPLPTVDQWYAEARSLLIPLQEGHLRVAAFFVPHNEHRIVLTRLLNLGLTLANRQWDPILEMVVNAGIDAGLAALLALLAWRLTRGLWAVAAIAAVAALFVAPTAWENALGAFQSQFYLLEGAALLHLGLVVTAAPLSGRWWTGYAAGILGLGTMGSGCFAPVIGLGMTVAGLAVEPGRRHRRSLLAVVLLYALCYAGVLLIHHVPGADAYRPTSVLEWFTFCAQCLAWPAGGGALQLPLAALVAVTAWKRRLGREAAVIIALGLWSWLQIAAQAFSRGHLGVQSKYVDLYAFALVANVLALARLAPRPRGWGRLALAAWMLLFGYGMGRQSYAARGQLARYQAEQAVEKGHVRTYVVGQDRAELLAVPADELPYPSAERLASVLDHPGIRPLLPPELRAPLRLNSEPAGLGFHADGRASDPIWILDPNVRWASELAAPAAGLPWLRFYYFGGPARFGLAGQPPVAAARTEKGMTLDLRRADVAHLRLQVAVGPAEVDFSDPVEMGWGSWAARRLCGASWLLIGLGFVLLAPALVWIGRREASSAP